MNRANPRLSVIIRTFNRADLLPDALESALQQRRQADEILVVDDASTDHTPEVMETYTKREASVRYLQLPENQGMYIAARIGFQESIGDCVAFLDSDDRWLPSHLECCLASMLQDQRRVMVFCDYGLMDEHGETMLERFREPTKDLDPLKSFLYKRVVVQPTRTLYARSAIEAVGGMPVNDVVGDWVLNVLLAASFPEGIHHEPQKTAFFRIHPGQSYSRPEKLRDELLSAIDELFDRLPAEWKSRKSEVVAVNLLHSAIFFWQAGMLGKA